MLKISYIEKEKELIQFWKEHNIFEKSVLQRPKDNPYVFYDGPPFATGLPHYGHILSFVTKDVFPRYWTMKNRRCERKWGWDCHGLPIESICERALDLRQKNEIYEMGISEFNEFCRSKVLWYTTEWKKTVERMGKWIEFDNSYKTMDNTYMETVWHIFKKIYDDGLVYRGKKILFYCPRCETPLSNFEISMDNSYKDISEQSITVKFKLKEEPMTYFLAWTTTPWTLIGNVALAVNREQEYVKIKRGDQYLILIENQLDIFTEDYEVIDEFKGVDLINLEYEPLYQISLETDKKGHFVIDGGDEVLSDEGTGIIHMAIYGEFDYEMIKKYDLPIIQHIDEHGNLAQGPREWIGSWFKDVDEEVIKDLQQRDLLFSSEDYSHSYPFCYRCDTPLIYNALDAWFIDIQQIKQKLLKTNEKIKWYPKDITRRYESIINSAPDWCISRNRFWATAMPIWECEECKQVKIIGSIKELQKNAVEKVPDKLDLHRHVVDNIHLKCPNCKKEMARVPEVFDCWLESGSMPYAAKHYPFENVEWFKHNFPSDFVSEYIGQVRAWFYYMHVISVLLFDEIPFKNVVVNGNILAEDGSKMSKSKRNFPDPNLIIEKYGADALRIYLMSSQLMRAQDLNFKEENVKQTYRRFNLLLINVLKFYSLIDIDTVTMDKNSENILDRWIVSLMNNLIRNITSLMDDYDTAEVSRLFFNFIEDLSTWYIKNSRIRFKNENMDVKLSAMNTLSYILFNLSKLLAPLTPFISEILYQKLVEKGIAKLDSVHLELWPEYDEKLVDLEVLEKMDTTREVVRKTLELRDKSKIPVRQALNKVNIIGVYFEDCYLKIISEAINVKEVTSEKTMDEAEVLVELDTEITPELKLEGIARNLIRNLNNYRKKLNLSPKNRINLYVETNNELISEALENHEEKIKKMIQADTIVQNLKGKQEKVKLKIENNFIEVHVEVKN